MGTGRFSITTEITELRSHMPLKQEPFTDLLDKFGPINAIRVTIFPLACRKVTLRRERRVHVYEFHLPLDLAADKRVLIQIAGLEELQVIALDDHVLPAGLISWAGFLDQLQLLCLFLELAAAEEPDDLERRSSSERRRLVEDRRLGPLARVFDGGDGGAVDGLEVEPGVQLWKQLLCQFFWELDAIVQTAQERQDFLLGQDDIAHRVPPNAEFRMKNLERGNRHSAFCILPSAFPPSVRLMSGMAVSNLPVAGPWRTDAAEQTIVLEPANLLENNPFRNPQTRSDGNAGDSRVRRDQRDDPLSGDW